MFVSYLTYQAVTGLQFFGIGALVGSSSTFVLNLLFNTVPNHAPPSSSSGFQELAEEANTQKNMLQSTAENLLESTQTTHQHLHQHLIGMDKAFDEYSEIRQTLFQSLRERQALEKNVTSMFALFESEESQLLKTISDLNHIKINQAHEIELLQKTLQSLLQCLAEKDTIIESLRAQQQTNLHAHIKRM